MNQGQQPRRWWDGAKDNWIVLALVALVITWLLTTTILFRFPLTTILSLFRWQSWDWRWLVLLGLIFLSAGVLYLTVRRVWNRLFDLTGFRGKTLWDLLGLLIVPAVIALAGWWLSEVSTRNQQEIEDQRAQAQQQIETGRAQAQQQIEIDRAQQSVLQSYIQDITELLLNKGLATSEPNQPVRVIARSSTLSTVRQLDGDRKGLLLRFLHESKLILHPLEDALSLPIDPIINLSGADLRNANLGSAFPTSADLTSADLSGADLTSADLTGADLRNANLTSATLSGAILSFANLSHANLSHTNLTSADLSGVVLTSANLTSANLSDANLSDAILIGADLSGAHLISDLSYANLSDANLGSDFLMYANLSGANLSGADLSDANLTSANLTSANLNGAKGWTNEQLAQAYSLFGATLPNGRVMTEGAWAEFKERYG